jgi:Spy/CpxP family protein refolding chaperone
VDPVALADAVPAASKRFCNLRDRPNQVCPKRMVAIFHPSNGVDFLRHRECGFYNTDLGPLAEVLNSYEWGSFITLFPKNVRVQESKTMKKLVKSLLVGTVAMALVSSVFAQVAGPQGGAPVDKSAHTGHAGGWMHMWKMNQEILAKLNLTDEQKSKVKALEEATKTKVKALMTERKAPGADMEKIKAEGKAIRKDAHDQLLGILTRDQAKQFKVLWKEAMEKAKKEKGGGL